MGQELVITAISNLRATPRDQAAQRPIVRVRGTVSLVGDGLVSSNDKPALSSLCIEDDSAGIWVSVSRAIREHVWLDSTDELLALHEGMEIEMEGQLHPGSFAPIILPSRIRVLGEKPLPPTKPVSIQRLMSGTVDIERGQLSGVVQSIADENGQRWLLKVETGLGHFLTRLPNTDAFRPERLLDAEVELTGLIAVSRNWRAEFVCPRLIVSHEEDVVIVKAPSLDPFASKKVSLNALDGYAVNGRPLHRRRIEGTVTYYKPGGKLYLQDGNCAVQVILTSHEAYAIGDRVEAVGFIDNTYIVAGLGGAIARRLSEGEAPLPIPISMSKIAEEIDVAKQRQTNSNPGYDGMLVSMTGRLLNIQGTTSLDGAQRLELSCDDSVTTAVVNGPVGSLQPGSEIRVTGIADIHYATVVETANIFTPVRIDLLVRSASDIVVVEVPSWWTPTRMIWVLVTLSALVVAVLSWAVALKRTVVSQTRKLAKAMQSRRDAAVEFQAALRERTRLAANLHDTLMQSITGIAYQIEACESESLPVSQRDENHLATAKRMIQRSQEDLRSAVWALRALPLHEGTFVESVRSVAKQISSGYDIQIIVENAKSLPVLADFIAGNLLLIVQEAVHNAIKHSKSRRILVTLMSLNSGKKISLTVHDDGIGFAVGTQPDSSSGHFGLQGMRERAERLSGSLEIQSEPGKGTRIIAQVPILDFDSYLA